MMKILECVPNFSEGCDMSVIGAIATAIANVPGVRLIEYSADADHHRSVFTFLGHPDDVVLAALAATQKALAAIDMRCHSGVHPRLGAVDVVPFIPLRDASMSDAVAAAHRFGQMLYDRFDVPIYFYGETARHASRRELADVRRGGYEALAAKLEDPTGKPDIGETMYDPRQGVTVVGARRPLVAFNINLQSDNLAVAQSIASAIREKNGGIPHLRAIGLLLKSRNLAQVSMNLVDCTQTSLKTIFDRVEIMAAQQGVSILESELIGLAPRCAFAGTTPEALKLSAFTDERLLETHIARFEKCTSAPG